MTAVKFRKGQVLFFNAFFKWE